jgi:predicted secreted acid phosphatase
MRVDRGDVVLVNSQRARVTDKATQDNLVRVKYESNSKTEWLLKSQVEWNYSEISESGLLDDYYI